MIIKNYNDYNVTPKGIVINVRTMRFMKQKKMPNGYMRVTLCKNGIHKDFYVHRLVAEHFIPNPLNKSQVNHIDENKSNNNMDNLEWMTPKENVGWSQKGEKSVNAKPKSYYSINPTRRYQFKLSCKRKCWKFNDFIEIFEGERDGYIKKYIYIEREKWYTLCMNKNIR